MKTIKRMTVLFSLFTTFLSAQTQRNDSLWKKWNNTSLPDTVRLECLDQLALAFKSTNPDSSLALAKLELTFSTEKQNNLYRGKSFLGLGRANAVLANYEQAIEDYNEAIKWFHKVNIPSLLLNTKNSLAYVFIERGEYEKAMDMLLLNINEATKNNDIKNKAMALQNIGVIYTYKDDTVMARKYYNEAIPLLIKADYKFGLANIYMNIANTFQNQPDTALAYLTKALHKQEEINDSNSIALCLLNIGCIYSLKGDQKSALEKMQTSLILNESMKDKNGMSLCYINIASVYNTQGTFKKAITNAGKALLLAEQTGNLNHQRFAHEMLYNSYDAMENYKAALFHYQQLIALNDSVESTARNKNLMKTEMAFQFQIKEDSLNAAQDKQDAIAYQQIQQQKIIRNSFIAGSILLMLLIVVLINRNKLKRTVEMEKMRSRLSRDLHDDIGSTLSSINILSRTAQNSLQQTDAEKTKGSLEKINERSQRLLDNMSDIIWNINPGNDTIEEVMSRMREYATTILEAKNIDYTFNFPKEKMDCKLSMEVKNNMYLIFKEAVNNLSKYSGASKANLSLTFDEKNIHLKVEDNGKGFNEDEIKHRGGLSNMQHRAEEIKGVIKINSSDKGTVIELSMPRYC